MRVFLFTLAIAVVFTVNVRSVAAGGLPGISGIELIPELPSTSDFIVIDVSGEVPSSGYTFPSEAKVTVSGQSISINIFAQGPTGIVLPVILSFSVPGDVGFLSAGNYQVFASLFVDGILRDSLSGSFQIELDSDADGVADNSDNCTLLANPDQRDTNGDGFGNICDPDLNNDAVVNAIDLGLFRAVFFSADPDADFNGDGIVNAGDLGSLRAFYFGPPGPSGIAL